MSPPQLPDSTYVPTLPRIPSLPRFFPARSFSSSLTHLVSSSQDTSSTWSPPVEVARDIRPRQILQIRASTLEICSRADKEIKAVIAIGVEDALSIGDIDDLVDGDFELGANSLTGLLGLVETVADPDGLGGGDEADHGGEDGE